MGPTHFAMENISHPINTSYQFCVIQDIQLERLNNQANDIKNLQFYQKQTTKLNTTHQMTRFWPDFDYSLVTLIS